MSDLKPTNRLQTDRFEAQLVEDASPYLLLGPLGGPFVRIESFDADVLMFLLRRIRKYPRVRRRARVKKEG